MIQLDLKPYDRTFDGPKAMEALEGTWELVLANGNTGYDWLKNARPDAVRCPSYGDLGWTDFSEASDSGVIAVISLLASFPLFRLRGPRTVAHQDEKRHRNLGLQMLV